MFYNYLITTYVIYIIDIIRNKHQYPLISITILIYNTRIRYYYNHVIQIDLTIYIYIYIYHHVIDHMFNDSGSFYR